MVADLHKRPPAGDRNGDEGARRASGEDSPLAMMRFRHPLRRYQQEIIELVNLKLERGERELHIVAPPGAGKTIIGLQIISQLRCPSLILSPNTTIQAQWSQKLDLFIPEDELPFGAEELIGTHEDKPLKPITVLTYQVLSTPGREQEYLERLAHQSWIKELTGGKSLSTGEAELRIMELMQKNPAAYQKEMSRHTSRLRRRLTEVMDLNEVLHDNALALLQALRRQQFKLVIFDECHHLTDYWAAVMTHLVKRLDDPVVVGLTGTPPEGKSATQETRYLKLVGEIDYQVPTPALVKEGGLAPFQDLVFFTTPTEAETAFLERQHDEFHALIAEMITPPAEGQVPRLTAWVLKRLDQARKNGWHDFVSRQRDLLSAACRYLWQQRLPIPPEIELSEALSQSPVIDDWLTLIEDCASHCLKLSSEQDDHLLLDRIRKAVRKLGYALTETGVRRQASPVDRVLAYSHSKPQAVAQILEVEHCNLGDRLRAVVVTDFERMSATSVRALKGVLDTESGGAVAVLRELLASPVGQWINPCLVTGSLLLVDRRIAEQFLAAAGDYIAREGYRFALITNEQDGEQFVEVTAGTCDWETRLYVAMATEIFERGITRCLIGTRGIFGEGWDSQALNTLVDLTTATSAVSVKQLRGRSIRIHSNDPLGARKVANNWDVVCIAPALEKGLNDYERFVRKHEGYFGISDDGQIECGVGHVHPSFSELTPVEVFASLEDLNKEMVQRALVRDKIYDLWKVGEKYSNRSLGCIEVGRMRKLALTPPNIRRDLKYKAHARHMRSELAGIWWEHAGLGALASGLVAYILSAWGVGLFAAALPMVVALVAARRRYTWLYEKLMHETCRPNTQESSLMDLCVAVLTSLQQVKLLPSRITKESIRITLRSDGSYRLFLDDVEPEHSQIFSRSMKELLAPIANQPYLIPKYEYSLPRTDSPEKSEAAFFRAYLRGRAEPRIAAYHALPRLLARSEKGREIFEAAWNKYVSPGFVVATSEKPELLKKYFGIGPSLSERLLWE